MANIFLSGPFDYKGEGWGHAHYSYGFALDSFKAIAEKYGLKVYNEKLREL